MLRPVRQTRDRDGYTRLADYGVLGDGRSAALVAVDGSVDWWAVARLDAAPTCAALLDPQDGGRVRLAPADGDASVGMQYRPGTNLLETTWETTSGRVTVTDALTSGNAGALPWTELARQVVGDRGEVEMELVVEPGDGLRSWSPWAEQVGEAHVLHAGDVTLSPRVPDGVELRQDGAAVRARFTVRGGESVTLAVVATAGQPLFLVTPDDVDSRLDLTEESWLRWSRQVRAGGDRHEQVVRSGLALKTLIVEGTGAIAAAATTSLPERVGGSKNWDYRYSWVRDATMTIEALGECGLQEEVHGALTWLLAAIRRQGPGLHVMYGLGGEMPAGSEEVDVPGWRGSRPVVVGNRAVGQTQLGVYGELFGTVERWVRAGHVLDIPTARELADLADQCADSWRRPDSGIWELPEERQYTSSKMNCWRSLSVAARLCAEGHVPGHAARWQREAERVRAYVEERCWSATRRAWTMDADSDRLDASVLLGARFGFDRGPRMSSTVDAVTQELGRGDLVYRYTGAAADEETFVACAYWRVSALARVGRTDEAQAAMKGLDTIQGPLGLLSEMVDAESGELVGNLPQALSHLAQIDAVLTLDNT